MDKRAQNEHSPITSVLSYDKLNKWLDFIRAFTSA
jgi:hypothetical protein